MGRVTTRARQNGAPVAKEQARTAADAPEREALYRTGQDRRHSVTVENRSDSWRYLDFEANSLAALSMKAATDFGCDT